MISSKKRYAQIGLGGRSVMFTEAVVSTYAHCSQMVGLSDINEGRLRLAGEFCREHGAEVPLFKAEAFERMIRECKPDTVIITTKDSTHDEYICRAMELGCDVITEKPMTIDEARCQKIIDVQKKTGKHIAVTFNYRYSPPRTQLKDLLMSGVIGDILSVDFNWMLNTHHGADYFRRWHRNKANSGGLMVHKATHHFDIVNWLLSAIPKKVFAMGQRKFYTPQMAERYGLTNRSERCLDCPEAKRCAFQLDLRARKSLRERYLECEKYDGYFRDHCVFSKDIDIEDTVNVLVEYDTGAKMTYSLNAFMPWEGHRIVFNGSKGRIEHVCQESVYVNGDGTVPGELMAEGTTTTIFPHFKTPYPVDIWTGSGGHGGGDTPLLKDIFDTDKTPDRYLRAADQRAGAYSILTGIAANHSMNTVKVISIDDLANGIGRPDYTAMPSSKDPLEMTKPDVKLVEVCEAQRLKSEEEAAKIRNS